MYVDDIVLTCNSVVEMNNLKELLAREFEIKDLENLKYFLGMKVARTRKGISISQRKYMLDLLKKTGMTWCTHVKSSMHSTVKLGIKENSAPVDRLRLLSKISAKTHLPFSH